MKATRIYVERCFNLGNYENEKVGIELEVEEGEKAADVLAHAKRFLDKNNPEILRDLMEYERAKSIIENPKAYMYVEVEDAKKLVEKIDAVSDDLPF